jgi:hypothetical protein
VQSPTPEKFECSVIDEQFFLAKSMVYVEICGKQGSMAFFPILITVSLSSLGGREGPFLIPTGCQSQWGLSSGRAAAEHWAETIIIYSVKVEGSAEVDWGVLTVRFRRLLFITW